MRRSLDGGASFEIPRTLSTGGMAAHVSLATHQGRAHAVWVDERSGSPEVHVMSSPDGGEHWLPERPLSPPRHASWVPSVSAWGDVAVAAWVDYRDGNEEEYIRVSRDSGMSWGEPVRVTENPADSWAPSVVVKEDKIFLAFFDRRVAGLLDRQVEAVLDVAAALVGVDVPEAPPRDPDVYYLPGFRARIAAKLEVIEQAAPGWVAAGGSPDQLAALLDEFDRRMDRWTQGWGIFVTRSPDLGETWEAPRLVSAPGGPALRPSLAASAGRLHLAWFDGRNGPYDVYYRMSPDAGAHFGPEQRLTDTPGDSIRPSLAAHGPSVHLMWMEETEDTNEIRYVRGSVLGAIPNR